MPQVQKKMKKVNNRDMSKTKKDKPVIEIAYNSKIESIEMNKSSKVEINVYANVEHQVHKQIVRTNLPENLEEGETYQNGKIIGRRSILLGPYKSDR